MRRRNHKRMMPFAVLYVLGLVMALLFPFKLLLILAIILLLIIAVAVLNGSR